MDNVNWRYGVQHMSRRHKITVAQANEALSDINAIWLDPDPSSGSGRSARVIGYSHSRREVLTIILVHQHQEKGYWGASGWKSNRSDRTRYAQGVK